MSLHAHHCNASICAPTCHSVTVWAEESFEKTYTWRIESSGFFLSIGLQNTSEIQADCKRATRLCIFKATICEFACQAPAQGGGPHFFSSFGFSKRLTSAYFLTFFAFTIEKALLMENESDHQLPCSVSSPQITSKVRRPLISLLEPAVQASMNAPLWTLNSRAISRPRRRRNSSFWLRRHKWEPYVGFPPALTAGPPEEHSDLLLYLWLWPKKACCLMLCRFCCTLQSMIHLAHANLGLKEKMRCGQ